MGKDLSRPGIGGVHLWNIPFETWERGYRTSGKDLWQEKSGGTNGWVCALGLRAWGASAPCGLPVRAARRQGAAPSSLESARAR